MASKLAPRRHPANALPPPSAPRPPAPRIRPPPPLSGRYLVGQPPESAFPTSMSSGRQRARAVALCRRVSSGHAAVSGRQRSRVRRGCALESDRDRGRRHQRAAPTRCSSAGRRAPGLEQFPQGARNDRAQIDPITRHVAFYVESGTCGPFPGPWTAGAFRSSRKR